MELKGSKTEQNLWTAFAGESQARNKYSYFASKAKKDGYEQIAAIFEETANNEKEHAKIWFKLLNGGIGSTEENLKAAAEGALITIRAILIAGRPAKRRIFRCRPKRCLQKIAAEILVQHPSAIVHGINRFYPKS